TSSLACPDKPGGLSALGQPVSLAMNFPGAPIGNAWYPVALANKLAGSDQSPGQTDIRLFVSRSVGTAQCIPEGFYYGLDGNAGSRIDLFTIVLHELAHGLGFGSTTSPSSGVENSGFPSVFDYFVLDTTTQKVWRNMTDAERAASGRNAGHVVWIGSNVAAAAASGRSRTPRPRRPG